MGCKQSTPSPYTKNNDGGTTLDTTTTTTALLSPHYGPVHCSAILPNGSVITGGDEGKCGFTTFSNNDDVSKLSEGGHKKAVTSLSCRRGDDCDAFFSSSRDLAVKLWERNAEDNGYQ